MRRPAAYEKPMKDFLSKYMQKNQNPSKRALQTSRNVFERTCRAVIANLGEKPFHVRAGLNAAVFDAVMTAFSNHLEDIPKDIHTRYKDLVRDHDFERNTRSSTTNVEVVQGRLKHATEKLFGA